MDEIWTNNPVVYSWGGVTSQHQPSHHQYQTLLFFIKYLQPRWMLMIRIAVEMHSHSHSAENRSGIIFIRALAR